MRHARVRSGNLCVLIACVVLVGFGSSEEEAIRETVILELDINLEDKPSLVVPLVSPEWLKQRIIKVYKRPHEQAGSVAEAIIEASATFNIPWQILSSMVGTESSFDPKARSIVGAIGPLQVRPEIWGELNYDLKNPRDNILAGAFILQSYKARCGGWECAMAAYNVGITNFTLKKKLAAQQKYLNKIEENGFWK
ncbi:lytic transglycosylase domain-containing protein [Hydrocarboniclastica marina]|uniref:Transglycosylase SLT domain-containing protein n=1 Tax=Hydrocarboniclastica marina TaxID=2259620 RepID=A0A4P7XM82_9ALTE|nr:lytic transglycosylase domain-containing protein [Hydrocarboniclastica marina]QCF28115.1 hypothetical protein soil367_18765 [Hydrocarboniclastica marina]